MDGQKQAAHQDVVVMTRNVVEAMDLVEILSDLGFNDVLVARDLEQGKERLSSLQGPPRLVVLGFDVASDGTADMCRKTRAAGIPVILVDADPARAEELRSVAVSRPFGTQDIKHAVEACGALPVL